MTSLNSKNLNNDEASPCTVTVVTEHESAFSGTYTTTRTYHHPSYEMGSEGCNSFIETMVNMRLSVVFGF